MKKQTTIITIIAILMLAATAHYYQIDKLMMVQSSIIQEDAKWTAGITSVSHLSSEEKLAMSGTRYAPPPSDAIIVSRPTPYGVAAPADPPTFDWRNVNGSDWMTSVKYQRCGSCWAYSATGVVEAAFNIYSDNPTLDLDLSEQHLISSCCSAGDCGGGWPDWAFDYIVTTGLSNETCFPNIGRDSACTPCSGWEDNKYQIVNNIYIPATKSDYKWALQEYGPLAVCLTTPEDWFFYVRGVYEPVWVSEGVGWANHAVVLVGWNDSLNAWICKNSYGSGWGNNGYGYVDYDVLMQYNYAYGVTGIVPHSVEGTEGIDDTTDTLTPDKPSYSPEEPIAMTASGENTGTEIWTGTVEFIITQPDGTVYDEITQTDISVPVGGSEDVTCDFSLPADAQIGTWTIQSKWIDDEGNVDAMASIQI
jgi:C1A family cysteine protease